MAGNDFDEVKYWNTYTSKCPTLKKDKLYKWDLSKRINIMIGNAHFGEEEEEKTDFLICIFLSQKCALTIN